MTQVLIVNLLLIVAAVVAASVAANPDIDLSSKPEAAMVLGFAVALTVLVNVFMLQRRFAPAGALGGRDGAGGPLAARREPGAPVRRVRRPRGGASGSSIAFRRMLERLECRAAPHLERRAEAQEEERARIARDLHDEVNQSLTGLLLRLEAVRRRPRPSSPTSWTRRRRSPTRRWRSC